MEKKKKQQLDPPDEHRCSHTNGKRWRCKNLKMGYGDYASVPKTSRCEKHYNMYFADYERRKKQKQKKKRSGDGEGSNPDLEKQLPPDDTIVPGGSAKIGAKKKRVERIQGSGEVKSLALAKTVVETRASRRRKILSGGGRFVVETSNQPATDHDNRDFDAIVEGGGSANNGRKRKYAERMSGELESLAGTSEVVAESESLEHYKRKCFELSVELEKKELELVKKKVELENMSADLEKKKAECTELHSKLVEVETRKITFTDENELTLTDATDRWKRKEIEKSTRGCGESRISNLESLVFRSGKESSILRCVGLHNSERVESEVPALRNDITQTCEKPTEESYRSELNAETSTGGKKDSHVYECKAKEKVLDVCDIGVNKNHESELTPHLASKGQNVEEGKGWGSSKRSSQYGSSSQDLLEMSTEPFANLVSDDGGESLGDPMDILTMKNWNRNKDAMKWKSEPDMLSSFEEDTELCLKAICALYRQEIEISPKRLHFLDDTLRCTTLAKFLMDKDCKGDVSKSVKELEMFNSKAVEDCKRLVRRYSDYLFQIYKNGKDPFFLPATSASHGEQTSK